ncbi:DUF1707 domain-containing protein [soil metagenome]
MVERRDIRVSDRDRQLAADRLKSAMDEGRLDLFEYDSRLAQAYGSATYAELDQLFHDLPPTVRPAEHAGTDVAPRRAARRPAPASSGLPLALKILWTVWASVVLINLVVWTLVSVNDSDANYFWPMWFLIPGTALFGATLGVQYIRRNRATG